MMAMRCYQRQKDRPDQFLENVRCLMCNQPIDGEKFVCSTAILEDRPMLFLAHLTCVTGEKR